MVLLIKMKKSPFSKWLCCCEQSIISFGDEQSINLGDLVSYEVLLDRIIIALINVIGSNLLGFVRSHQWPASGQTSSFPSRLYQQQLHSYLVVNLSSPDCPTHLLQRPPPHSPSASISRAASSAFLPPTVRPLAFSASFSSETFISSTAACDSTGKGPLGGLLYEPSSNATPESFMRPSHFSNKVVSPAPAQPSSRVPEE
mmetsp:Transcript_28365/g.42184  ORF Transcript_28365/g.42184 Transcript_28365/m.42184 type:complete len:200 (+) Transcript_28365:205-804(+)